MASVGGSPDFMLTVWDWEREKIVLRSKAFSQDIYRVTFSPENPGQLTTSGTGHIRYTHDMTPVHQLTVILGCTSSRTQSGECWT